jgi:ribonuclease HI
MNNDKVVKESSTVVGTDKALTGAVIYTDGSCKYTNPGFIGWGGHGYTYKLTEGIKPTVVEGNTITNEGYSPVNRKSSILTEKPVEVINYLDFLGSSLSQGTNNEAELQAFTHSMERLAEMDLDVISVYTDSQYVRNGITDWCKTWERHDWLKQDGTQVTNHLWWIRAYGIYKKLIAKGVHVSVNWVKGHNDIFGNTHADILAGIGTNYSMDMVARNEFKITEAKGYWKSEIDRHPFLNFKRIYFNSVSKYNNKGHYFQADTGGADLLIGKRIPETGLSVIKLVDHDQAIEDVKQRQYDIAMETNAIIMMKLDRVFSKEIYPYLVEHSKYCLLSSKANPYGSRPNLNINFFDKQAVTVEVNPTGLSMRALESFNLLEELLDKFTQYRENGFNLMDNNIQLNAHDVTSMFYDMEDKSIKGENQTVYSLKSDFVVGFRDFSIDIEESYNGSLVKVKVPLILGTDLPPRNNLKKLEEFKPTIYLLTWRESENSMRYATIIDCESGIGIWSNFFADRIFFPKQLTE